MFCVYIGFIDFSLYLKARESKCRFNLKFFSKYLLPKREYKDILKKLYCKCDSAVYGNECFFYTDDA